MQKFNRKTHGNSFALIARISHMNILINEIPVFTRVYGPIISHCEIKVKSTSQCGSTWFGLVHYISLNDAKLLAIIKVVNMLGVVGKQGKLARKLLCG